MMRPLAMNEFVQQRRNETGFKVEREAMEDVLLKASPVYMVK